MAIAVPIYAHRITMDIDRGREHRSAPCDYRNYQLSVDSLLLLNLVALILTEQLLELDL